MRTSDITALDPGDNAALDREYGYSPVGNLLSRETEQEDFSYTYDNLSRLTNSSSEKYTYDSVGNRLSSADTSEPWSYNRNNELLDNGKSSFEYDDSGRLIKRDTPSGVLHYSYNAQGRLSKIEDGSGNVIAEYYYDPFGRRLWKEVDGERTYFLYSQEGLIGEYKETGQAIRNYGYRPDTTWGSNPLFLKKDSDYYWYLNDRQGTPKKLISNNGKVVWSAQYDSFGKAHVSTELVENNLRLAGQYYDIETGLHYNLNRYYDPSLGRYLTPDPLREGLNPYLYAQNNPLMYVDPLGLCVVNNVNWGAVRKGAIETFIGVAAVYGGAMVSASAIGATAGVPAILAGSASIGWGVSQMTAGFMGNEIPFMGTKEAIIKNTTKSEKLEDKLLGTNELVNMLSTRGTSPSKTGKISDALQSGQSIYESGSTIIEEMNNDKDVNNGKGDQ